MRNCTRCKIDKPEEEFNKSARNRDGLQWHCRACSNSISREYYKNNTQRFRVLSKKWREVNRDKYDTYRKNYYETNRVSILARNRERWKKRKDYALKYKYGIDLSRMGDMIKAQGEACAICKGLFGGTTSSRPHVDHDHVTGRVRGVLCPKCNRLLGNAGDDVSVLRSAISYLLEGLNANKNLEEKRA